MNTPSENLSVILCQTCGNDQPEQNIAGIRRLLDNTDTAGADLVVIPENAIYRGDFIVAGYDPPTLEQHHETLGNVTRDIGICTVWGSVQVARDNAIYNTALVIGADGELITTYEKIHLFQLFTGTSSVDETSRFAHGENPASFTLNGWTIALTICYDLRFPELYRVYAGADLMLCPAEFTHMTGEAHWEILLRARAIENQCYVAGVNQCGMNEPMQVLAYGHSMMIAPWGEILTAAEEDEICLRSELSYQAITEARQRVPSLQSMQQAVTWSNSH